MKDLTFYINLADLDYFKIYFNDRITEVKIQKHTVAITISELQAFDIYQLYWFGRNVEKNSI